MSERGFSAAGLVRMHEVMAAHVDRGAMPGLVTLVARGVNAHVDVIGTKSFGATEPMERDAIFRIASLTKPITAAAAMILVDDGVLRLHDPVDDLLPELADRRVLRSIDAQLDDTVPAARPITLEDLLTFRFGFGFGAVLFSPDPFPIQIAEAELELMTLGPPWPPTPNAPDEWMRRLGSLPLMCQPGERWLYGTSAPVLGVLIARAAGKPFEAFLRERVFEPLGMVDTGFTFSAQQRDRLTTAYAPDPETDVLSVIDAVAGSYWGKPVPAPDGGGWLLSTIDDFWAFVQMVLRRGEHGGVRVLSETSVELMTTDHLTAEQRSDAAAFLDGSGWGFGMAAPAPGASIPRFGWEGGTGTAWRSNPDRDLTGILLTQRAMTSPEPPQSFTDFWRGAYDAITD